MLCVLVFFDELIFCGVNREDVLLVFVMLNVNFGILLVWRW